jgi:hypothetical protein
VDVPEIPRTTLAGEKVQARPVDGDMEELRFTVPVNPFTDATVTVVVPAEAALVVKLVGLAVIEKSGTAMLNATVAACESDPLVALTVTL